MVATLVANLAAVVAAWLDPPTHRPVAMLALAFGKARTGAALGNPVLQTEARVTIVDAYLAGAVLVGLMLNATLGWWWADPLAGFVIVSYGAREGWHAWHEGGGA